jgi:predicted TIM-barrel fold metal-dependent hydrolase
MRGAGIVTATFGDPVIDCDVHQFLPNVQALLPYLSRAYQEDMKQYGLRMPGAGGYLNGGDRGYRVDSWPDDGGRPASNVEMLRRQLLDAYNIEYAILLGQDLRGIPNMPDADFASALAAAYNNWMIEEWLEKDERLKGALFIASQNPKVAAQEIERVGSHPSVVAVVGINGVRFPYGQRYYDPIFEACEALGLPFMIHTGGEGSHGQPTPAGYPSYYIEIRQARQMGYMAHLASMIFEGLFERYPKLRVVFVEGGFVWLPTVLWRLDSDWRGLRSHTPWVQKEPSQYVWEHCLFTSQPMEMAERPRQLLNVFEWAHAEKTLMFASDYPHWDFDNPEAALPAMPDQMRRRVLYQTAREVFHLPARLPEVAVAAD